MNRCLRSASMLFFSLLIAPSHATADTLLFSDDFEGNLLQWVGQDGGVHSAVIVTDPIRTDNHVVSFTSLTAAGDIFGSEFFVVPGLQYRLDFEYLGLPGSGVPGDLGGFIGIAEGTPDAHRWLDGTSLGLSQAENDSLIDDGSWRSYSLLFDPFDEDHVALRNHGLPLHPSDNTIRVMLEDFDESFGVPGDVFFDNIRLRFIPEPSGIVLAAMGFIGFLVVRWRRWKRYGLNYSDTISQ